MAVIDLDGVVADVRHRLVHLESKPKNWDGFFAGIPDDPLLAEGATVAQRLATDHDIVYLTGRPEWTRATTLDWLARHHLPQGTLIMRSQGDRRPARLVKPQLLRRLAAGRHVAVVVDDDPAVCGVLEQQGWPVLRAEWMSDSPQLFTAQERDGRT